MVLRRWEWCLVIHQCKYHLLLCVQLAGRTDSMEKAKGQRDLECTLSTWQWRL